MEFIKENTEIKEKDTILNNLGMKYNTVKNPITFCHIFLENVSEMIGFLGS